VTDFAELRRDLAAVLAAMPSDVGVPDHNPLADWLLDWSRFWSDDHDGEQWALEPLFAAGRGHALYAGAKTGKSYVVLSAIAALVTGQRWLGYRNDPIDVLYLDAEMTADDLRDRLTEFGYGATSDLSRLHYALLPTLPGLDTDEGGAALLAAVRAVEAQLVVIDTTSRLLSFQGGRDENSAKPFQDFYRYTGMRLKSEGIAWVRIDHAGKDVDKGQRGSSAKVDDVDVVWKLVRREGGVTLTATHRRMSWIPEKVDIAITDADGEVRFDLFGGRATYPPGTKEAARLLDRLGVPLESSVRKARARVREAKERVAQDVLAAAVRWRRDEAEAAWMAGVPVDNPVDNSSVTPSVTPDSDHWRNTEAEHRETAGVTPCVTVVTPSEPTCVTPGTSIDVPGYAGPGSETAVTPTEDDLF
jgi:hypothetical protein